MTEEKYRNASQQRILKVLTLLAGNEFNGLLPSEIAKAVGASQSNITRDLQNLRIAGLAEQVPGLEGRWRLGPKVIQIAISFQTHIQRVNDRLDEVKQRYTRDPR